MKYEHSGHVYSTENPVLIAMYDADDTFVRICDEKPEEPPKKRRATKK